MDGARAQVVVVIVLSVVATIFIALRLWAKQKRRSLARDDVLIIIGLLMTFVLGVQDILWVYIGYEGKQMNELNPEQVESFMKWFFANQITYTMVPLPIKLSILLSYHKIFGAFNYFRLSSYIVGAATIAWSIIMLFVCVFQCHPPSAFWMHPGPEYCIDLTHYAYGNAISNLLLDVIILAMPAIPLWQLQISSLQRRLAAGSFALGFFVCIASIVRITTISNVGAADLTSAIVAPGTWTFIEPTVGIISACLPFLRPLISRSRAGTSAYGTGARPQAEITPVPYGANEQHNEGKKKRPHSSLSALQHGRSGISGMGGSDGSYAQLSTPSRESFEMRLMGAGQGRRGTDAVLVDGVRR